MSHRMPEDAAVDIYHDILAKHHGDHAKAQQAVAELGLPLPRSAPYLTRHPSLQDHGASSQQAVAPAATNATPNPGFLCPLTGIVMRDPVVLEATCISFERIAIMWWLSVNPDTCPVTGRAVAEGVLRNDDELREAILAWAKVSAPHLVDYRGRLIAATFPDGIERAVQEHRAMSMALPDMRSTAHAGFAGTSGAASTSRNFSSNRIHQQHPEYLAVHDSMAMDSPGNHNWGLYQYESKLAHQRQIQEDRNFALALAQAGTSTEMPGDAVLPHKLVLWSRLARTRSRQHFYMVIPPVMNAVLLCGFLFGLFKNDWGISPVEQNPWLGPTADALRQSGGSCSACLKRGEWWRLLSAVVVPAGIIHLFSTMAFLSVASVIATRTALGPLAFLTSILIGSVAGSATSGLTAPKTISSASSGLAAAAVATSAVAVFSIRRLVESWMPILTLLLVMLVLLFITGLAPLVDSWTIVSGAVGAGICTSAMLAPYSAKSATKGAERRVVTWQVACALLLVTVAAVITASLLMMPRTGYSCKLCSTVSCQDFFGWQCRAAIDSEGFCEVTVFPDSRAVLACPDGSEEDLESIRDALSEDEVDQRCEDLCRTDR